MGKAARAACIFTPMVLTIASLVCIVLINMGGYSKHSDTLNGLSFFDIDFSNFSTPSTSSELSVVLKAAQSSGAISDFYEIHLWNYCVGNETQSKSGSNSSTTRKVASCSERKMGFWFDPLDVLNIESILNDTTSSLGGAAGETASNIIESVTGTNLTAMEDKFLDKGARRALKIYKKVSGWLFVAYFASIWLLLATVLFGIVAVFTRWLALITCIISLVGSIFVFAASLTATIMFPIVVKALNKTFEDYNIKSTTTSYTRSVTWLATAFSLGATLFWLFATCCCSGRSNPHHRSNTDAPAKDLGFGGGNNHQGKSMRVEKTGGYQRVQDPYHGGNDGDNVPLTQVAAPPGAAGSYYGQQQHGASPYEPYRHN